MTRAENNAMRTDTRRGKKLTEDMVREIRALKTVSRATKPIADRFGIDPSTVRQIMSGRRWWWLK
jgi:transcriptional regulator with XRE-family HTH domain